jgi:hypothetical protein
VVSRIPAAEFARVKVGFPAWSVRRVQPGKGVRFTTHRRLEDGSQQPYALALADVAHQLWLAERTDIRPGGCGDLVL